MCQTLRDTTSGVIHYARKDSGPSGTITYRRPAARLYRCAERSNADREHRLPREARGGSYAAGVGGLTPYVKAGCHTTGEREHADQDEWEASSPTRTKARIGTTAAAL